VHLVGFILRIYHEARSSECHIQQSLIQSAMEWPHRANLSELSLCVTFRCAVPLKTGTGPVIHYFRLQRFFECCFVSRVHDPVYASFVFPIVGFQNFEYLHGSFEANMCFGATWCSLFYMLLLDQVETV
jgi:hypothetical protein